MDRKLLRLTALVGLVAVLFIAGLACANTEEEVQTELAVNQEESIQQYEALVATEDSASETEVVATAEEMVEPADVAETVTAAKPAGKLTLPPRREAAAAVEEATATEPETVVAADEIEELVDVSGTTASLLAPASVAETVAAQGEVEVEYVMRTIYTDEGPEVVMVPMVVHDRVCSRGERTGSAF